MKISAIPQIYRNVNRWREILTILSKYGLADWIARFDLKFAKGLFKASDGELLANYSHESRIRLALTQLGPTFIKLGQILSTRPDLIGVELAEELENLQTDVAADPPEVVRRTIYSELGQSVEQLFQEFEDQPMASASIGQVHRARLYSGEMVVVKVRHAKIEKRINIDLDILAGLALLAQRVPEFSNYRPKAIVAEFRRTLQRELDFNREQRNLRQFGRDFKNDPTVRIPRSYPDLSTAGVLTMEFLEGQRLSEASGNGLAREDLEEIARRGTNLYLKMIFTNGFYHADPHPGNLVVMPGNVIGLLDFGMVGRLDERLRDQIEEMLLAIGNHDASHLTSLITRVGMVPSDLDSSALNTDIADFISHYVNQPLDEFDLSAALKEITEIIRRYRIMLPPQLSMLIKVLVMLEGTSRLASPSFSLFEVIKPFQRQMLLRRMSPARQIKKFWKIFREVEHAAEVLPGRLMDISRQIESGQFDVHLDHRQLEPSVNRLVLGLLTSSLFIGSALLMSFKVPPLLKDISVLGALGIALSFLLGLKLLRAIGKSGRLDRRG